LIYDCQENYVHKLNASLNQDGLAHFCYKVPIKSGDNYILITAPDTVINNRQFIAITAKPADPDKIQITVSSTLPDIAVNHYRAVANDKDIFSIYYTIVDTYGNPVPNVNIKFTVVSTENPESRVETYPTSYQGIVDLSPYGPSTIPYITTITAALPQYPSVIQRIDLFEFITGNPSQFIVSAIPNTISSRDVPNHENNYSIISAHLMDSLGRGIEGKTIHFSIVRETPEGELLFPSSFDKNQFINMTNSTTDSDGFATVQLFPAIFSNTSNQSTNLKGEVLIDAFLKINESFSINSSTILTYKNYPYIRAEVTFDKNGTGLNETFNATLCLIGDGYTPPHKPVDVMLIFSRGISMLQNQANNPIDPEIHVRWAIKNFTKYFDESTDRFGLWTFGEIGHADLLDTKLVKNSELVGDDDHGEDDVLTIDGKNPLYRGEGYPGNGRWYTDYATPDTGPENSSSAFNSNNSIARLISEINMIVPFNNDQMATWKDVAFRYGVYKGLNDLIENSRSEAEVKAVIVLVDENWDLFGSPIAQANFYECPQHLLNQTNPCVENSDASSKGSKDYIALPLGYTIGTYPYGFEPINNSPESSWQNPSIYARDNDVLLFVIEYSEFVDASRTGILDQLASPSSEYHIYANDPDSLNEAFERIAKEILIYAAVNTSLELNFNDMNVTSVNGTEVMDGNEFFDYQYLRGYSTLVKSSINNIPINDSFPVPPYPSDVVPAPFLDGDKEYIKFPYSINQTKHWENNNLSLYVGNISIGQTWCANFMFKSKNLGCIDIFGSSSISIGDEEDIPFDPTVFCVRNDTAAQFKFLNSLDILELNSTLDNSSVLLTSHWLLNYTGTSEIQQIAYYNYSLDNVTWSGWIPFATNFTGGENINSSNSSGYIETLDVRDLVGSIRIKVFSFELSRGGAYDEAFIDPIPINRSGAIKIE
jgi:hypothetical protein